MTGHILIVGGGLAGLSAARRLQAQGFATTVLEAAETVGGRTYSESSGDAWINLGAQYVGGAEVPAARLARDLGTGLIPLTESRIAALFGDRFIEAQGILGLALRMPFSIRGRLSLIATAMRLEWLRRRLGGSHARKLRHELDAQDFGTVLGNVHPEVSSLYRSVIVRMTGGEPADVSAFLGLLWTPGVVRARLPELQGSEQIFAVDGGTSQLAKDAAAALKGPVHLGCRINAIEESTDRITLHDDQGRTWEGDAVVLATPAAEAARIGESLPDDVRKRLKGVTYCSFVVAALSHEGRPPPPWDRHFAVQVIGSPFHVMSNLAWPLQARAVPPARSHYVAIAGGKFARELLEQDDRVVSEAAMAVLWRICPQLRGTQIRTTIRRWPVGIPYWTPGRIAEGRLPHAFARVALAGDYLDFPNMQGAIRSGERAADAILEHFRSQSTTRR
jgi:monoamine oxidase